MSKVLLCSILCSLMLPSVLANNDNIITAADKSSMLRSTYSGKKTNTQSKKKRLRIGFESGVIGRLDYFTISPKKDLMPKFRNVIKNGNFVKISQAELSNTMNAIMPETPNLVANFNALDANGRKTILSEIVSIAKIYFKKRGQITASDIKASMDKICNVLGVDQLAPPNIWNIAHEPKYLDVISMLMSNPSLIKADVTVDEINQSLRNQAVTIIDATSKLLTNNPSFNTTTKLKDYVNLDFFSKFFINYSVTDRFYLIAGLGGALDVYKVDRPYNSGMDLSYFEDTYYSYNAKYAIVPEIGFGFQYSKRFAVEVTGYDRLTKIEWDCSGLYKEAAVKRLLSVLPGITEILPDEKQSNWVNRFGIGLSLKFNITDKIFTKLGISYTFPCNVFKKIYPIDLHLQTVGISLSFGSSF